MATTTRKRLILLAFALIPMTLLLVAVFSWMFNRPIKQLKASIRQLGRAPANPSFAARDGARPACHLQGGGMPPGPYPDLY